jgi:hypothetical protein
VRRASRCLTVLAAIGLVAALATPAAAKPGKISPKDACTIVTAKQVQRFGAPVSAPIQSAAKLDCKFPVGQDPATTPGGSFTALVLYPNVFAAKVKDARAGLEDQYAINKLANEDLQDVSGLGPSAFFNATEHYVAFAPNKKLGVILRWEPAPAGTPISARDKAKLIALAKAVTKRANG